MIEIRTYQAEDQSYYHKVFVEGLAVKDVYVYAHTYKTTTALVFSVNIYDQGDSERLAAYPFDKLPADIEHIELNIPRTWSDLVQIHIYRDDEKHNFKVCFEFRFDFDEWKRLYSISEYVEEFDKVLKVAECPNMTWDYDDDIKANGLRITFPVESSDLLIIGEIERLSSLLQSYNDKVENALVSRIYHDSVVMYFDFPEEVKVPCEQYLLYFIQFLKDIGVEATAELQHQMGQVLFAVTPANVHDALDRIRMALEVYIALPSSSLSGLSAESNNIAIQRLAGNIYHLKSQLSLAQAMLQAKEATIQAQLITIDYQQRLLSGQIIADSLKQVTPQFKEEDKEELFGGKLAITKYKTQGIEVNLPELYRLLKRLFTGDK